MKVYLLWHVREIAPERDEQKLIGVFSTKKKAKDAIDYLLEKPGFKDFPDNFEIYDYLVDGIGWTDGFIEVT